MLLENTLNIIYPNVCGLCKEICRQNICNKCKLKISNEIKFDINKYHDKYFDEHAYLFNYNGKLRELLLSYKFYEQSYLHKFFAELILQEQNAKKFINKYEIIIPVPLHYKRLKQRGYNQTELIAKQICKDLDKIQMNTDILYKIKQTSPQSSLNRQARGNNLKNVYIVKKQEIIYNKRVLLIDDIYTTGNTANECSKALKKSGVHQIRSTYIIERLKVGIKWKI